MASMQRNENHGQATLARLVQHLDLARVNNHRIQEQRQQFIQHPRGEPQQEIRQRRTHIVQQLEGAFLIVLNQFLVVRLIIAIYVVELLNSRPLNRLLEALVLQHGALHPRVIVLFNGVHFEQVTADILYIFVIGC